MLRNKMESNSDDEEEYDDQIHVADYQSSLKAPKWPKTTIYIELGNHVAIVRHEPLANLALEDDADLNTKVQKFLGLMAPRRRLYNPDKGCDPEPTSVQVNTFDSPPARPVTPPPTPQRHLNPITSKRQANDIILQVNANCLEIDTPDFLKKPIDLSNLPSKKNLAKICRMHRGSIACLENHPHLYTFVESLNPTTSIELCHPLALTYRQRRFNSCKVELSKRLFNIFNHAIFHCGLLAPIVWERNMRTPCKSDLAIDALGQRNARILLCRKISHQDTLIQSLLHEMIHAAAFVFNQEAGHGDHCRKWAYQAGNAMPELPTIYDCHATFMYTCTMCARCSYGRIDFKKEELRCHYCQFEVNVKPFQKGNIFMGTRPDPTITPFKSFIRDNYLKLGEDDGPTHSSKMRLLNEKYSKINASTN
ncbi:uncharacterized protein LOC108039413 [Drosophila rhopaloa]|uniref:Uncharacterized protein LOC108039413 n=1 Tax=Drosophila rhopaloa TaxID=1041015 RepID=A0A6P4EF09_DRORH|nr:uncharacterized protein LOC108039413 [Drosophila rhopaloa]